MRLALIIASVLTGAIAALLGFGHVPEHAADILGWLSLSVSLFAAAHLPFDRS